MSFFIITVDNRHLCALKSTSYIRKFNGCRSKVHEIGRLYSDLAGTEDAVLVFMLLHKPSYVTQPHLLHCPTDTFSGMYCYTTLNLMIKGIYRDLFIYSFRLQIYFNVSDS